MNFSFGIFVTLALTVSPVSEGAVVVGYWSEWSSWGPCSKTCLQGVQYRTRTCIQAVPGTTGCTDRWWEAKSCTVLTNCYNVLPTTASVTSTTTTSTTTATTELTYQVDTSCLNPDNRDSYRGVASRTISGYTCQRWDSQHPHPHNYMFPQAGLDDNYCRNPDNDEKPWCFTANPNKQWEYCEVVLCEESEKDKPNIVECFDSNIPQSYVGTISNTAAGIPCQYWNSSTPHKNLLPTDRYARTHLGNHNYCRNPDNDTKPWCFTTDPNINWAYCDVPLCEDSENALSSSTTILDSECGKPRVPMAARHNDPSPVVPMFPYGRFTSEGLLEEGGYEDNDEGRENGFGAYESTPGSIPWQVSIRRSYSRSHFCGGAIIASGWIISAAHCITQPQKPSSYYGIVGSHNQYINELHQKRVDFTSIYRHPSYSFTTLANDITVMKTKTPIVFAENISPICLPSAQTLPEDSGMGIISGWGTMLVSGSREFLHQASVPIIELDECRQVLQTENLSMGSLCSGYIDGENDSCQGDSGGPLAVEPTSGSFVLAGIVSWGFGCADEGKPVVFTRVSHYVDWITSIIR